MVTKLSVLAAATAALILLCCCQKANCRRLSDDIETNEIEANQGGNVDFSHPAEWVKISEPPYPVITRTLGSRVELECEAIGSPTPVMQWFKDHQKLTENESYDSNSILDAPSRGMAKVRTRLVINHALPIHQGTFTCFAESGSQIATAQTKLMVTKKADHTRNFTTLLATQILGAHHVPRITLWVATMMDVLGSDVVFPCQTVGNPKPELLWFDPYGNIIVNSDERVQVLPDGALRIRSIIWNDMGTYTCVSKNVLGQDNVETFLYPMKDAK